MITARVAQIDHLISLQLNEVMHHPQFQKLEGTWRGPEIPAGPVRNQHAVEDPHPERFEEGIAARLCSEPPEFDQSAMFKKVYEDEYGIFGGEPMGALVGDYEFSKHPEDLELLEKVSQVAAAAHAPFLSAASPELLNMAQLHQTSTSLATSARSSTAPNTPSGRASAKAKTRSTSASPAPRILMRLPYGRDTKPVDGFNYEEGGRRHRSLQVSLGQRRLRAGVQDDSGFRDCMPGALPSAASRAAAWSTGLPSHTFRTDEGDVALKCPTEIAITDRREKELADQGLVPLVHCKGTDKAAFFSIQSCNKPKLYDSDSATANARISAQLPYMMATCRFAHYLKAMMRDKIGSFMSRDDAGAS